MQVEISEKCCRKSFPLLKMYVNEGDDAVIEYIEEFDKVKLTPESLRVSQADIEEAYAKTDPIVLEMIRKQIELSRRFHEAQLASINMQWEVKTIPGVRLGAGKERQLNRPDYMFREEPLPIQQ